MMAISHEAKTMPFHFTKKRIAQTAILFLLSFNILYCILYISYVYPIYKYISLYYSLALIAADSAS